MNTMHSTPMTTQPLLRRARISTNIRLHQDFINNPRSFARKHDVKLVDDIRPEIHFGGTPDSSGHDDRNEKSTTNFDLIRYGAIRLLLASDNKVDCIRTIHLNPSMLLYGREKHGMAGNDLARSLDMLKKVVAPLLADPLDAVRIVPGLVPHDEPMASWSMADIEFQFPGIDIRCLHDLSQPLAGHAYGATHNCIQFGDKKDKCVIRIKKAKWKITGSDEVRAVDGIRVRLILKGGALVNEFKPFGNIAKENDTSRLVGFTEATIERVHQTVMSRMQGTYLPVPPEWKNREGGKSLTTAKAMALVSMLTSIPLEELRALDEEIHHPSPSTCKRLDKTLSMEFSRLAPVPVSTLFQPSAYLRQPTDVHQAADKIDPEILAIYGRE